MRFNFADAEKGRELITREDEYINRLSSVELTMRLGRYAVTAAEYAQSLGGCVLEWGAQDIAKLEPLFNDVKNIIGGLGISSEDINIVKTDGSEEYNSAYTRENTIFLPPNKISYEPERLKGLILHEFFHIFFRLRKDIQSRLYKLVGFELINEIKLPESIAARKLTNPDGPVLNYCFKANLGGRSAVLCPVTMLREGLGSIDAEKDIMESIEFRLLEIEKSGETWRPLLIKGREPLISLDEQRLKIREDSLDPNEILAEVFVKLASGKDDNSVDTGRFRELLEN